MHNYAKWVKKTKQKCPDNGEWMVDAEVVKYRYGVR